MMLDLIKLLKPGEVIEIRDNSNEVDIVLWDRNGSKIAFSTRTFMIWELEKIKQNKDAFSKQLIKSLRRDIKIHKEENQN